MYRLFIIGTALFIWSSVLAQIPERMSYQAVVRNTSNQLIRNQSIGIRVSIIQGTPSGAVIFRETYDPNPVTNANGLITLEIGGGIQGIGIFEDIDWSAGPYFIMTETDPAGGTDYTITGTSQILSVPYAFYAETSGNGFSGDYNDLKNQPSLSAVATTGNYNDLIALPSLFDGNYNSLIDKPELFDGNYNSLIDRPELFDSSWHNITEKPTTLNGYGITDAVRTTGNQSIGGDKVFTGTLSANALINLPDPVNDQDAATKSYVDELEHRLQNLVYSRLPVASQGMAAYYPFNGNAKDESGNGRDGTVNGASLTHDRFGIANKAYMFNSSNKNHITINSAVGNFGISNFSISVWVKRTSAAGYEIFTQRSTPYRNSSWWELGWGTFTINENLAYESKININADDTLRNNVWYLFTGVREATAIKFYLNGELLAENTTIQVLNIENNTNTEIGCHFYEEPLQCFNGVIDDIRLYNRALSEDEINQIYNEGNFPGTLIGEEDDNSYNTLDWEGKVMTVHGLIPADSLGITLPHEHLLIVHNFNSNDLTSEADAISELKRYADRGGRSLVEVTNIGIGRNPPALKRIAAATGVNVISGTGCYKDSWVPDTVKSKSVEQLTNMMVNDIVKGINGIHCGIIGEIGISRPITNFEKKLVKASALAQLATGAAIYLHFDRQVVASDRHYVLDMLENEGADLTQVVVGHNIPYVELVNDIISYAQRGCFVAFDMTGLEVLLYFEHELKLFESVKAIVDRGYIDNLLISQDVCFSQCLVKNGGFGYENLLKNYVPNFLTRGLTQEQINTIMIDNPKRMLALR